MRYLKAMEIKLINLIICCFLVTNILFSNIITEDNIEKNKSEQKFTIHNVNDWIQDSIGCLKKRKIGRASCRERV